MPQQKRMISVTWSWVRLAVRNPAAGSEILQEDSPHLFGVNSDENLLTNADHEASITESVTQVGLP
jgi:hypothetical protein